MVFSHILGDQWAWGTHFRISFIWSVAFSVSCWICKFLLFKTNIYVLFTVSKTPFRNKPLADNNICMRWYQRFGDQIVSYKWETLNNPNQELRRILPKKQIVRIGFPIDQDKTHNHRHFQCWHRRLWLCCILYPLCSDLIKRNSIYFHDTNIRFPNPLYCGITFSTFISASTFKLPVSLNGFILVYLCLLALALR